MNFTITARHFKLPEDLRSYIEEKVARLNRYYDAIIGLEIILGWEKLMRYAELKIKVNNKQIVVKETSEDLRKSFDFALDNAERQLKRYKQKVRTKDIDKIHSA